MKIGKLGVWASTENMTAEEAASFAKRVEGWGYSVLWLPEAVGRNVLVHSAWLLANTTSLVIATGIANIYARDAAAMAAAQLTLAEQSGGRFLLGMGVSHAPIVESVRGHVFEKPIGKMRRYLEAMAKVQYMSPRPAERPLTLVAALGPQMLALTAELADGAHPYNVTPEHTAEARAALGPDKWLCPEQMVLLEIDPAVARAAARKILEIYLGLPNYRNNLVRIGFGEKDFEGGGSDRLIDAMIAWGDEAAIRRRIQAHWDAGADHVCIQAVPHDGDIMNGRPNERIFELLAPAAG
ncbi:MAG: class F420-dependent oxidoreductase [Rhodospirillales bacterium]|nr:class F420-dependent oxidoreductase [Rhodospirillales bacterium]